ncbi:MAG: DUF4278 domain-containing protein [Leptolyngbyaceae cyanobacterium SM2_3_12]|nr:DUF4278 domain-containing protein [Leptolyngbyaceae cyanobacterium SM2_3_12]
MKLTYRGVSYDHTPNPIPSMGSTVDVGTYRGARLAFHALADLPEQPDADLTWRGVSYHSGIAPAQPAIAVTAEVVSTPVVPNPVAGDAPASRIPELARNLFMRRHQRSRKREQGMMVRLAAEVGLPVDEAAHYESHIQGKMPHDFAGYDRGSSAMS